VVPLGRLLGRSVEMTVTGIPSGAGISHIPSGDGPHFTIMSALVTVTPTPVRAWVAVKPPDSTAVYVDAPPTVKTVLPELPILLESLPYVAVIPRPPGVAPSMLMAHDSRVDRMHEAGMGRLTLPGTEGLKVTVPVGDEPPETTTTHVETSPTAKVDGEHMMTVMG